MIQLQFLLNVRFYYKNLSLDKTRLYNSIQHLQHYNFICQFKSHRLSRGIVFYVIVILQTALQFQSTQKIEYLIDCKWGSSIGKCYSEHQRSTSVSLIGYCRIHSYSVFIIRQLDCCGQQYLEIILERREKSGASLRSPSTHLQKYVYAFGYYIFFFLITIFFMIF